MDKKISKDTPLGELTLRRYEAPSNETGRRLVRKLCLSFGLLQPGDSRDVIVDVLYVLLKAKKQKKYLSSDEIVERVIKDRKLAKQPMLGIAASNIRRQILRLRDLLLVEKIKNVYRITEFQSIATIYDTRIKAILLQSTLERVREYVEAIDLVFEKPIKEN
jgi:hypothetical protein